MALEEVYHGRIESRDSSVLRYVREWECLTTEIQQAAGGWVGNGVTLAAFGDAYGLGTWTGLVEPAMSGLTVDPHFTKTKARISAQYVAPRALQSGPGTAVELITSKHYYMDFKKGRWSGTRQFWSSSSTANGNRNEIAALKWRVGGIQLTPRRVEVIWRDPQAPGAVRIIAHYQFSDNPDAYALGRAVLSIQGYGVEERLKYEQMLDKKGNMVDDTTKGIETKPDPKGRYWRLVGGSNQRLRPEAKYIFRTALAQSEIDWSKGYNGIGRVAANELRVPAEDGTVMAKPGEWMLLAVEIPEQFFFDGDDDLVPVRYVFLFRKGGFANCKAQRFRKILVKEYVMHDTDDPKGWANDAKAKPRVYMADGTGSTTLGDALPSTNINGAGGYPAYAQPLGAAKWRIVEKEVPAPEADKDGKDVLTRDILGEPYDFSFITSLAEWPR